MELIITGLEEFNEYLTTVVGRVSSDEFWAKILGLEGFLGKSKRFAVSISPVVTGSYAGAHRLTTGGTTSELFIDPSARNTATGELVSRYAAKVEERHGVYKQTYTYTQRIAAQGIDSIGDRLIA